MDNANRYFVWVILVITSLLTVIINVISLNYSPGGNLQTNETIPTAKLHVKGIDAASVNFTFKVVDNIGIEVFSIKNDELARCPFCNGDVYIHKAVNDIENPAWTVDCIGNECPRVVKKWQKTPREAVNEWNEKAKQTIIDQG